MDLELSQLDKVYLSDLANYNRTLNQRNRLLKECLLTEMIYWTHWMYGICSWFSMADTDHCRGGSGLSRRSNAIISGDIHQKLTGGRERISLIRMSLDAEHLSLEAALEKNRERDIRMKSTSVGPHRDDICFMVRWDRHPQIRIPGTAEDSGTFAETVGDRAGTADHKGYAGAAA